MAKKRIIDQRKKEKFMVDDEYLNGMARLVGHQGTLVYFSLCRHVSKDQECFPSIKLMAEEHSVSTKTIKRGIKNLEKRRVIKVEQKRTKSGYWLNNTYTLLDKSEWDYSGGTNSPTDTGGTNSPARRDKCTPDGGTNVPLKETHSEGNTSKETHKEKNKKERKEVTKDSPLGTQISEIIFQFTSITPTITYDHTGHRKSAQDLIKQFGFQKALATAKYAISIQGRDYAPTITTPSKLKYKIGDLQVYYKKDNKSQVADINL